MLPDPRAALAELFHFAPHLLQSPGGMAPRGQSLGHSSVYARIPPPGVEILQGLLLTLQLQEGQNLCSGP